MISSRHLLAFALALLATAGLAALPTTAATTPVDDGEEIVTEPPCDIEDPTTTPDVGCVLDQTCRFTPYPDAGYPDCVRKTIWSP